MSWLHNDARLSRLVAGQDLSNRRMDDTLRGFHSGMMSFQASMLETVYQLRERVTVVESKLSS